MYGDPSRADHQSRYFGFLRGLSREATKGFSYDYALVAYYRTVDYRRCRGLVLSAPGERDPREARRHADVGSRSDFSLMNQTSVIAAALIVGFVIFVTMRGELPKYLAVIGLGG